MTQGKTVSLDGIPIGKLVACVESTDDLVAALRARMAYIGVSFGLVEDLADMSEGALGKYLAPLRTKQLTINSLLKISGALGLRAMLIIDPKAVAKISSSWEKADQRRIHARRQPPLSPTTLRRIVPAAAAEMGRRGALVRLKNTTPEERRRFGQVGAQKRWHPVTSSTSEENDHDDE